MSELKVRKSASEAWQTIETQRTKIRKKPSWKWGAHRGAYMEGWPENTIPSLVRAKERGFRYSECDIQFTSDGVMVICHDPTISGKKADGNSVTLTIAESTAEEVCALTLAASPRFGYIHPCTFDEYLIVAYYIGIDVIIHGGKTVEEGRLIAQAVVRNDMVGRVMYSTALSAADGIVSVDKHAAIEFCVMGEFSVPDDWSGYTELLAKCDYVGFDIMAGNIPTAEVIAAIHEKGLGINFWDVSNANYAACLDVKPKVMLLASDKSDFHTWEKEYLDSVKLW